MNVLWVPISLPNERGAIAYRCKRCGIVTAPTASPTDRIHHICSPPDTWIVRLLLPAPGDVLKAIISAGTNGNAYHGADCEIFRRRMNARGWRYLWADRHTILDRIRKQADKEGYRADWLALSARLALALVRLACARLVPARGKPKQ